MDCASRNKMHLHFFVIAFMAVSSRRTIVSAAAQFHIRFQSWLFRGAESF